MASNLEQVKTNDTPHSGVSTQAGVDSGGSQVSASEPARKVEEGKCELLAVDNLIK